MKKLLSLLWALPLFALSACSTSVITEEERQLPQTTAENQTFQTTVSPTVIMGESYIAFTGSHDLASHEGKFEDFAFEMVLDPDGPSNLENASMEIEIQIDSMTTDSDGLTKHLLNEDFFEADTFPVATFVSDQITIDEDGENTYEISGDLTIRDITQSVTIPATITPAYLTAQYNLNRLDFGVGEEGKINETVPLEIKLVFETSE